MIGLSFVAFLDILGFSQMVISDCESANPGEKFLLKLKSAIHEALSQATEADAKIVQFSDSIVVSSLFKPCPQTFISFCNFVNNLQSVLFQNDILCRGGVCHGRHFHDETILFSQTLIDSYKIESSIAINPRVVLSRETIDLIFPNGPKNLPVLLDSDGNYFLDYFSNLDSLKISSCLQNHEPILRSEESSAKSKIAWLFRYANFHDPSFNVPDSICLRRIGPDEQD